MPLSPPEIGRTTTSHIFVSPPIRMGTVGILGSVVLDDITRVRSLLETSARDRTPMQWQLQPFGGAATHAAEACSRPGLFQKVLVMAQVPLDAWGDKWMQKMNKARVITRYCMRYQGRIQNNKVWEDDHGLRRICVDGARQPGTRRLPYNLSPIPSLERLLIAGSVDAEVVRRAVEAAVEARVPVSWRPARDHADLLRELGRWVTLLQIDRDDAPAFLGLPDGEEPANIAYELRSRIRPRYAVVTAAPEGCYGAGPGGGAPFAAPAPRFAGGWPVTGWRTRFFAFVDYALRMESGNLFRAMEVASEQVGNPSLQPGS